MIVGGDFVSGGDMQLYAACYDCVVAQNKFRKFGFTNWGRNPHGSGWQPNLNNLVADNAMLGDSGIMGVLGCGLTCSDAAGGHCVSIRSRSACSGNATSLLGRDCVAFGPDAYAGAVNMQIAWRRNVMRSLDFTHGVQPFPLVDAGIVDRTMWLTPFIPLELNRTTNVLVRD